MAGREFGPPPSIVPEFDSIWRQWLHLVYRKIYKRTHTLTLPFSESRGHASLPMAAGLLNFSPVHLADDTTDEYQYFGFNLPENWVPGTDLKLYVRFALVSSQTGVKDVRTSIEFAVRPLGNSLSGSNGGINDIKTLEENATANTYRETGVITIPKNTLSLGVSIFIELYRKASTDSCVGDVAYQNIFIEYQGYINHE